MIDLYLYDPGYYTNAAGETIKGEPYVAMCHEPGFLDGNNCILTQLLLKNEHPEPLTELLEHIKSWLLRDSDTLISLQIESRFGESGAGDALYEVFREAGLAHYLYIPQVDPQEIQEWPTLGDLRHSNRRLIVFSDNINDGFIHTSTYRETRFDLSKYSQCEMREDNRDTQKIMPLFVLNHFYGLSIRLNGFWRDYQSVNAYSNIMARVALCEQEHNMLPNFLVLDFIEEGEMGGALQAATDINLQKKERFLHECVNRPLHEDDLLIFDVTL
jgi:hypothetical protein